MTQRINWTSTPDDRDLINKICDRAFNNPLIKDQFCGFVDPRATITMDLTATHLNGTPLELEDLLLADDANFGHDVCGISGNIDRETGQLLNCFLPRFARKEH